jgi:hypothetical protein
VWFASDREKLYLVPVTGADSAWYKNVVKTPTVRLAAAGVQVDATATPIVDTAKVERVLDMFRATYGARDVEAYYPKHDVAVEVPLADGFGGTSSTASSDLTNNTPRTD